MPRRIAWRAVTGVASLLAVVTGVVAPAGAAPKAGGGWHRVYAAAVSGHGDLTSIDCPSATSCLAVGYDKSLHVVALSWNGKRWRSLQPPSVTGNSDYPPAVSCSSNRFCEVVGSQKAGNYFKPMALVFTGRRWKRQHLPSVPHGKTNYGSGGAALSSVACPLSNECLGVGYTAQYSKVSTLVVRLTSAGGTRLASGNPDPHFNGLNSITCGSARSCFAVGTTTSSGPIQATWHGGSVRVKKLSGWTTKQYPSGVSCASANTCVAVGSTYSGNLLVGRFSSGHWRFATRKHAFLRGVSCQSATSCIAAGNTFTSQSTKPLVTTIRPGALRNASLPSTPGAQLNAATCSASGHCFAVGFIFNGANYQNRELIDES